MTSFHRLGKDKLIIQREQVSGAKVQPENKDTVHIRRAELEGGCSHSMTSSE